MNFTFSDVAVVNCAVNYTTKHHIKGVERKREENIRQSAIVAIDKLQHYSNQFTLEEARPIYVCLIFYAQEMSKSVLPINQDSLETALDIADELKDMIENSGVSI